MLYMTGMYLPLFMDEAYCLTDGSVLPRCWQYTASIVAEDCQGAGRVLPTRVGRDVKRKFLSIMRISPEADL